MQYFFVYNPRAAICRIITSGDVVPLVNAVVLQEIRIVLNFVHSNGQRSTDFTFNKKARLAAPTSERSSPSRVQRGPCPRLTPTLFICSEMPITWARRQPTALNTSCELRFHGPEKCLCGIFTLANCCSLIRHAGNLSTVSLGNASPRLCPLTRQIFFKIKQAPIVLRFCDSATSTPDHNQSVSDVFRFSWLSGPINSFGQIWHTSQKLRKLEPTSMEKMYQFCRPDEGLLGGSTEFQLNLDNSPIRNCQGRILQLWYSLALSRAVRWSG